MCCPESFWVEGLRPVTLPEILWAATRDREKSARASSPALTVTRVARSGEVSLGKSARHRPLRRAFSALAPRPVTRLFRLIPRPRFRLKPLDSKSRVLVRTDGTRLCHLWWRWLRGRGDGLEECRYNAWLPSKRSAWEPCVIS